MSVEEEQQPRGARNLWYAHLAPEHQLAVLNSIGPRKCLCPCGSALGRCGKRTHSGKICMHHMVRPPISDRPIDFGGIKRCARSGRSTLETAELQQWIVENGSLARVCDPTPADVAIWEADRPRDSAARR